MFRFISEAITLLILIQSLLLSACAAPNLTWNVPDVHVIDEEKALPHLHDQDANVHFTEENLAENEDVIDNIESDGSQKDDNNANLEKFQSQEYIDLPSDDDFYDAYIEDFRPVQIKPHVLPTVPRRPHPTVAPPIAIFAVKYIEPAIADVTPRSTLDLTDTPHIETQLELPSKATTTDLPPPLNA